MRLLALLAFVSLFSSRARWSISIRGVTQSAMRRRGGGGVEEVDQGAKVLTGSVGGMFIYEKEKHSLHVLITESI